MMGFDSRANYALSHSRLWQLLTVIHFRSYFESLPLWDLNRPSPEVSGRFVSHGGDDGIRTHDPLLAGQVLSQLSYTPILGK